MKTKLLALIFIISLLNINAQTALNFDGVNDYVLGTNNNSLDLTQGTIEAWIKTDNAGSEWRAIINKQNAFGIYLHDNKLAIWDMGNWRGIYTNENLADNLWHHIAFSFNNNVTDGSKLYVDGQLVLTTTVGVPISSNSLRVGCSPGTSGPIQHFSGDIDQVRVWNTIRTNADILANYNKCLLGNESGLIMYWNFDEGSGTTVTDTTGNNNNGTLTNMDAATDWVNGYDCSLVAYYPFNGNANDESGNGNNGTVNGATLTTDRFGNTNSAFEFDGIDDFIQVANSNSLNIFNSDLTISMWLFNYSDSKFTYKGISKGGYDTGAGYELVFNNDYSSDGELQFNISKSARRVPSINTYNNQWVMLTATYTHATETRNTYINGVEKSFTIFNEAILKSSTSDLYIGKRAPGNNYIGFVNGKMDDIRIYNSALTATEILNLYNLNTLKIEKFDNVTESPFYVNNNTLYFKKAQNLQEIEAIEVYNSIGQKMLKTSNIKNEISFKTLPIGVYILKVKNFNSNIQTLRFLIN
jgi:hypothetical protein